MKEFFFNPTYVSLTNTLIKVAVFLILGGLIIWGLYAMVSKVKFIKPEMRKEILLRHAFLWSLLLFFLILNIYYFSLFYFTGSDFVNPLSYKFYRGLLPQLLLFISVIVFFFIRRRALLEISKQKLAK